LDEGVIMSIKIIDSRDLVNGWRIVDDKTGNFRSRGLPFRYSYVGSFVQALAEYFVRVYSNPGDAILEPFGGRGSVMMQALYHNRNAVCNDLSAYSNVLTHSVLWVPHMEDAIDYIEDLRKYIEDSNNKIDMSYTGKGKGIDSDIAMLYHPDTFSQMVKLRNTLNSKKFLMGHGFGKYDPKYEHEIVMFLRAVSTQLMLGSSLAFNGIKIRGQDNTTIKGLLKYYNFLKEKPRNIDVFNSLKLYVAKMNVGNLRLKDKFDKLDRKLISCDAKNLDLPDKCIDGVITSPPYFHVLRYGKSNWTRLWMLDSIGDPLVKSGIDNSGTKRKIADTNTSDIHGKLYDKITDSTSSTLDNPNAYSNFTGQYLKELYRVLKDDAFAIIVVGNYGNKQKTAAWKIVTDRAVLFGFKVDMIINDRLNENLKSSSQMNAKTGGGGNDYDVCVVLYKGKYEMKNKPEDIDFRWGANLVDKRQRSVDDDWG
jgi:DNA modification methylase